MLHLFNKTYLTLDFNINLNDHRIVISEKNGFPLLIDLQSISGGSLIAKSTSLEELFLSQDENFESFSNIVEMFSYCNTFNNDNDVRILIQADSKSFIKIAACFYKIIFENPTAESTYKIIQSAFYKKAVIGLTTNSIGQKHWLESLPSKAEYTEAFAEINELDSGAAEFLSVVNNKLSLDYYIASFLVDGSKKDQLKEVIHKNCTRIASSYVKDTWEVIRTNITNPKFKILLGYTKDYNLDNLFEIFNDQDFDIYKKLLPSSFPGNFAKSIQGEASFTLLTQQEVDTVITHVAKCTLWTDEINNSIFVINIAFNSLNDITDEKIEQFLTVEKESSLRTTKERDRDNWNIYMLEHIYNSADIDELLPYKLK